MVNDLGRYLITQNDADKYKFKVPSLRNLAYTAPYMHDGRLLTLDAVLDHYTSQVQNTPNLDPLLEQSNTTRDSNNGCRKSQNNFVSKHFE